MEGHGLSELYVSASLKLIYESARYIKYFQTNMEANFWGKTALFNKENLIHGIFSNYT